VFAGGVLVGVGVAVATVWAMPQPAVADIANIKTIVASSNLGFI
jgi:hypothetical protein